MPLRDQTGTPGLVGLTHFHSSTISGSASLMSRRTFSSVSPRQSASSEILVSIRLEAAMSAGAGDPRRAPVAGGDPRRARGAAAFFGAAFLADLAGLLLMLRSFASDQRPPPAGFAFVPTVNFQRTL